MDTAKLKKFAQEARRLLIEQISTRLDRVLTIDSSELREHEDTLKELRKKLEKEKKSDLVERVAYIWFNRFCALRFMDVNRYTKMGILSPAEGHTQPEILHEAKQGHIDDTFEPFLKKKTIIDLLNGQIKATDPQQEAYKGLLVAVCNYYNTIMPFMFEKIADYTELLMPEDLLSQNSILQTVINTLDADNCNDVEVIGWLYQFYISEKKDEVFAALKKKKKISTESIPAATQLFTPDWIVHYLVENTLGRLWVLNRPSSKLKMVMKFYIQPEQPDDNFLKISSPEELKVCDPACGSGHLLVYAFEILYKIYEEEGYDASIIPGLILEKNLYGMEIDDRAGALAKFSLFMKARAKYKRFFSKTVQPNVCVLENISFSKVELDEYFNDFGAELLTPEQKETLHQFEEAKNFGSLIRPTADNLNNLIAKLSDMYMSGKLFSSQSHYKVVNLFKQANYLDNKYHVVIANPPYMGGKGMNKKLKSFLKINFDDYKSDLFSAFIERNLKLTKQRGYLGFVTPYVWMFISSFEKLRARLLSSSTLTSLIQLEYNAFAPACIPVCSFTLFNASAPDYKGSYVRLSEFKGASNQAPNCLEAIRNHKCGWFYNASANDFKKISGYPIAYWVDDYFREIFVLSKPFEIVAKPRQGIATADNDLFLRRWHEISYAKIAFSLNSKEEAQKLKVKWLPYNKGGQFRKWFGNNEFVINWENDGEAIRNFKNDSGEVRSAIRNPNYFFKKSVTWTDVSSSCFGVRMSDKGFLFDGSSHSAFPLIDDFNIIAGFLCSKLAYEFLKVINPTMHFQVGNIAILPLKYNEIESIREKINNLVDEILEISKMDWNSLEISWDFKNIPILNSATKGKSLKKNYEGYREYTKNIIDKIQSHEEINNEAFIQLYGLQDTLSSTVDISDVSLFCNPYYRYDSKKPKEELEKLLLTDTMKEFLSYSVGCMLGRYSLDKPGLILANQGDTIKEYLSQIPDPIFRPDIDNVIPILDGEWFTDDIVEKFRIFLKTTFGIDHYEENLASIEEALSKNIRKYFLTDFYKDHVKMYKKRPIYWLFSSPKGSFNALIYMHRYQPDTVSIVLNDYLREFKTKITAHREHLEQLSISSSATQKEKTKAIKEIEKLKKQIDELDEYERDILYPLATKKIEIDLDDGVKVNYPKFGKALKKVPGLS